jgi:hypothetical protein
MIYFLAGGLVTGVQPPDWTHLRFGVSELNIVFNTVSVIRIGSPSGGIHVAGLRLGLCILADFLRILLVEFWTSPAYAERCNEIVMWTAWWNSSCHESRCSIIWWCHWVMKDFLMICGRLNYFSMGDFQARNWSQFHSGPWMNAKQKHPCATGDANSVEKTTELLHLSWIMSRTSQFVCDELLTRTRGIGFSGRLREIKCYIKVTNVSSGCQSDLFPTPLHLAGPSRMEWVLGKMNIGGREFPKSFTTAAAWSFHVVLWRLPIQFDSFPFQPPFYAVWEQRLLPCRQC